MGRPRGPRYYDARRRLRPRRLACGGGEHDSRALSLSATVTLFVAQDCHLCERARDELGALSAELGFVVDEVDITGVPELESLYREWIPVVEVDGERVSVYRVEPAQLRHKLGLA